MGTASGDSVFYSVTDFCESSGAASGDPFVPFDFIASFLWAPPVETQFSVVRAPPVATLVISCHRIISVAPPVATQFSVLSYSVLSVRAPSVTTLLCHLSSSPHLSGLRLWRLSFLFCDRLYTHTYIHTYIHTYTRTYV